jgi:hypothetical protein
MSQIPVSWLPNMIYDKFLEILEEFRADEEKLQDKSAQSEGHGKKIRESILRSYLWPNEKFENQNQERW